MNGAFARLVRRRLSERGLGLREFCRSVDLDPSFFSKVLAGKRSPPSEDAVLRRIARALELDERELIVSAGRIPGEWERLCTDRRLLDAVHRLCSGAPASRWDGAARPPAPAVVPAPSRFGDELL